MRILTADYIYPISSEPIKNGFVSVDDDGAIIDISESVVNTKLHQYIEKYDGIICPGFVNTHCHLELSHLRNKITKHIGIDGFIKELVAMRSTFNSKEIIDAIVVAEAEMIQNGIVAVGDISNNNSSFRQKGKENLVYHTFLEVFDLNPKKAEAIFESSQKLKNELLEICSLNSMSNVSIVPHAPYTVSNQLFQLIYSEALKNNSIISIHNQESEEENEFFYSNTGRLFETISNLGFGIDDFQKTGLNSLQTTLPKLPLKNKIVLVHNTFTTKEDIIWAYTNYNNLQSTLYWCTCPNANLYIENKLPNYNFFIETKSKVTIGTDSLASNWSLSVLDELKTITSYFPNISLQTLLTWATKNGAELLGFDKLGTIEKGKSPGLNLLKRIDVLHITKDTMVQKLL